MLQAITFPSMVDAAEHKKEQKFYDKFRLLFITLSALIFTSSENYLPDVKILSTSIFFNSSFLKIIFYSICIVIIINGINFIDGANGLASFASLSILSTLLYIDLFFCVNKNTLLILITMISVFPFLFFNFPMGLIFLGDTGAYWLGLMISIITIKIFASNDNLSPWLAIVVLLYPLIEVLFSFIRKLYNKNSPFKPDIKHLHMRLFFYLKNQREVTNKFSSYVTLFMFPIWILPLIFCLLILKFNQKSYLITVCIIIYFLIYYFSYYIIKKNYKHKQGNKT